MAQALDKLATRYSVTQAKDNLPGLLYQLEESGVVEITRRGTPVAVFLSMEEYRRLKGERPSLWEAIQELRNHPDFEPLDDGFFEGLRDSSPGREPPF